MSSPSIQAVTEIVITTPGFQQYESMTSTTSHMFVPSISMFTTMRSLYGDGDDEERFSEHGSSSSMSVGPRSPIPTSHMFVVPTAATRSLYGDDDVDVVSRYRCPTCWSHILPCCAVILFLCVCLFGALMYIFVRI